MWSPLVLGKNAHKNYATLDFDWMSSRSYLLCTVSYLRRISCYGCITSVINAKQPYFVFSESLCAEQPQGFVKRSIRHVKSHNAWFIGHGLRSVVLFYSWSWIGPCSQWKILLAWLKKTAPRSDKDHPLNLNNANLTINVLFVRMMCNSGLFPDLLSSKHSSSGPFNPPGIVNGNSPWVSGP